MAATTPNMGLKVWNLLTDPYDHAQLADNFAKIDLHDHSNGKGLQIPTAGIADGSITTAKLATTVTATPADGSVSLPKLGADVTAQYEPAFSTYKMLIERSQVFIPTTVAGTYPLSNVGGANQAVGAVNNPANMAFYYDPADWTANARTTKLRLRVACYTNATASGITFTVGLYPVTAIAGAAGSFPIVSTVGTVTAGSTVAFASPGTSAGVQANSGDFTAPAAGFYLLAAVNSGTVPASAEVILVGTLQMRQV